jgi:hypothetical protein
LFGSELLQLVEMLILSGFGSVRLYVKINDEKQINCDDQQTNQSQQPKTTQLQRSD